MKPGSPFVIPAPDQVRGFNIRDPVPHRNWIADRACPGLDPGSAMTSAPGGNAAARVVHDRQLCGNKKWLKLEASKHAPSYSKQ
jgi:hypothetical protein